MDIKTELTKLTAIGGKARLTAMEKAEMIGTLALLSAVSADDDAEVAADVFEALDNAGRKLALGGLAFILMQVLDQK